MLLKDLRMKTMQNKTQLGEKNGKKNLVSSSCDTT